MNFLTVVLCLAMNRPYQEYYFVPLISFWFSMQYLLMAIPPVVRTKLGTLNRSSRSKKCILSVPISKSNVDPFDECD